MAPYRLRYILLLICLHLSVPAGAAAQRLSDFETNRLLIELQGGPESGYRMSIKPKGGLDSLDSDLTARVFAISSPSRLVIDVPNIAGTEDKRIALSDSRLQRIRLGKHPEKTRFVIDIRNNLKPQYDVRSDPEAEALLVEFQILDEIMTESEPDPASKPVRQAASQVTSTPRQAASPVDPAAPAATPQKPVKPVLGGGVKSDADALLLKAIQAAQQESGAAAAESGTQEPPELPVAVAKNAAASQTGGEAPEPGAPSAVVKGIFFQAPKGSKTGGVMIDVDNINTYTLNQRNENLFELMLENAELSGNHLLLPQFPPEAFGGFEVLVARQRGEQVLIKIYVARGTELFPYIADDNLWLKAEK